MKVLKTNENRHLFYKMWPTIFVLFLRKKLSQIFQLALADIQFEYGKFIKFIKEFTRMVKIDSSKFCFEQCVC